MTIGPIQICIVGFKGASFRPEILDELNRVGDSDVIRIIDVLGVVKTADGELRAITDNDVSAGETAEIGPVMGALLGIQGDRSPTNGVQGDIAEKSAQGVEDAQVFNLAEEMLPGEAAAIAVIEHRWMARVEDAVARLGGTFLLDTYVNSDDLIGLGSRVARALETGTGAR